MTMIPTQVKQHPFFRDINWDTLARQKVWLRYALFIEVIRFHLTVSVLAHGSERQAMKT